MIVSTSLIEHRSGWFNGWEKSETKPISWANAQRSSRCKGNFDLHIAPDDDDILTSCEEIGSLSLWMTWNVLAKLSVVFFLEKNECPYRTESSWSSNVLNRKKEKRTELGVCLIRFFWEIYFCHEHLVFLPIGIDDDDERNGTPLKRVLFSLSDSIRFTKQLTTCS